MGNCFVGKPADTKPNNFAKRTRTIDIHDDAIVSALNVESTKKKYDDEFKEEEKINVEEVLSAQKLCVNGNALEKYEKKRKKEQDENKERRRERT